MFFCLYVEAVMESNTRTYESWVDIALKKKITKPSIEQKSIMHDVLEQIATLNFKYPDRCIKIFGKGWRQYLGAGQNCAPEINEERKQWT